MIHWAIPKRNVIALIKKAYGFLAETMEVSIHKDLAVYYAHDAKNIYSGRRTLAGITGDWRPIDQLARECLEWFKFVNPEGLKRVGLMIGLKPRI